MRLQKGKVALLVVIPSFVWGAVLPGQAITIAENGKAQAVIVIAKDASEPEQHAAAELAEFLGQVSGAPFEVVNDPPPQKSRLFIGQKAAKEADPDFTTEGLGAEGIVIRTVGNDLILAGGYPRGTLYAVYTFLEDYVGCRWWSSTVSTIPKKTSLKIGALSLRYVPEFSYRESHWFDAFDRDWSVRNKFNGNMYRLDAKRGGKVTFMSGLRRTMHTFYELISPEKYFKEHPEWFSEIEGKRSVERSQLCLSNEEMRAELVKNLRELLRKDPAADIAWVAQNEGPGNCQCAHCAAIDAEEGSPAGLMVRFVNAVAADLEAEFSHILFGTMAFQYSRKPPKHAKTRPNVIVVLASYECSFSKPLADERNQDFRDDIAGWSKVCNRLYVWDYVTNFNHYILPHPNLRVLGPNIKFFVEHNVKWVTEQGADRTPGAELAELRAWVIAKLLWNPALDPQKLIDEFIDGYYGAAGPHLKAYLKLTHDAVEASGDWLGCTSPHTAKFLSFEVLSQGLTHLKAAEAAVATDEDLQFRVQVAQLPLIYAFLMRWDEMRQAAQAASAAWPMPNSIEEAFDHYFMKVARKKGISRLREYPNGFGALEEAVKGAKK